MDRPRHIDLGSNESRAPSAASRIGLPSPRIQHFDGDIPPSLSPLDAFAAHSRRLAKELEETRLAGQRRMSRLPPQLITQSLNQHQANRPAIFRSLSGTTEEGTPPVAQADQEYIGYSPEFTEPITRPASAYPYISNVMGAGERGESQEHRSQERNGAKDERSTAEAYGVPVGLHQLSQPSDYFGVPAAESPVQYAESHAGRISSEDKHKSNSQSNSTHSLIPPNAAFARSKPYHESSEDDYASSNAGSFFSQVRKLSSSSNVSVPRTPASPAVNHERSPSNNSTTSLAGHKKIPSHLNFSRPRSSASLQGMVESPSRLKHSLQRKSSYTSEYNPRSQPSFDDTRSVMSDGHLTGHASSYTHSKFALPRGRADRTSALFSGLSTPHFEWVEPMFPSTPPMNAKDSSNMVEPSVQPLERHSLDIASEQSRELGFSFEFLRDESVSLNQTRPASAHTQTSPIRQTTLTSSRPTTAHGTANYNAQKMPTLPPIPGSTMESSVDGQSRSSRSNSTVRPTTSRSVSNYQSLSPDDHVTKAIELHQHGDLKESTYHLRIAARQDHPTGMLLYALACRHGWGIRPNQKEGVSWLKKAMDTAMLEVADDEDSKSDKPKPDFLEKKAHRAQFALSIYELGVSHLNGWGVDQDKALALRCFEIAGNWGDPDALTEAGFCYAEGIGCKKDLKKAARFYRMAEKKGISMVGNSWIYKDKYNDDNDKENNTNSREGRASRKGSTSEKTPRSKSKSRSIFGRKKSVAVPA